MEQQQDPSSATSSDPVEDSPGAPEPESVVERYFWAFLLGAVLLAATLSVGVVYTQYSQVDQTLRSLPYADQAAQLTGSIPYADRVARAMPYVAGSKDSTAQAADESREYGSFTKMEGLVVNPAGTGGERYLAASLAFESKSPSVIEELKTKKVVVRDAVLTLLSERTADELSTPDRRDELKAMLRKETNRILSNGTVDRLYFTEFVLQ